MRLNALAYHPTPQGDFTREDLALLGEEAAWELKSLRSQVAELTSSKRNAEVRLRAIERKREEKDSELLSLRVEVADLTAYKRNAEARLKVVEHRRDLSQDGGGVGGGSGENIGDGPGGGQKKRPEARPHHSPRGGTPQGNGSERSYSERSSYSYGSSYSDSDYAQSPRDSKGFQPLQDAHDRKLEAPQAAARPPPRAAAAAEVEQAEMRIDAEDGRAYTKAEFIDCYGGTAEWEAAPPQRSGPGVKGGQRGSPSDPRVLTDGRPAADPGPGARNYEHSDQGSGSYTGSYTESYTESEMSSGYAESSAGSFSGGRGERTKGRKSPPPARTGKGKGKGKGKGG